MTLSCRFMQSSLLREPYSTSQQWFLITKFADQPYLFLQFLTSVCVSRDPLLNIDHCINTIIRSSVIHQEALSLRDLQSLLRKSSGYGIPSCSGLCFSHPSNSLPCRRTKHKLLRPHLPTARGYGHSCCQGGHDE